MKIAFLFLAILVPAFAEQDPVGIIGFKYIDDRAAFVADGSKGLSAERQHAVRVAKAFLALYFDAEVQGRFSVAEATWGFQVNFSHLNIKKDKGWFEASEGFGEIFLSKDMGRIRIDYGP